MCAVQPPSAPVVASIALDDPSRGSVTPSALLWTPATWQMPQQLVLSVANQVRSFCGHLPVHTWPAKQLIREAATLTIH